MSEKLHHATITIERTYSASIERLFSMFADPQARAKWSTSSNDALVYDKSDFREGGRDQFRCGPKDDLRFKGLTTYQVIDPNRCVVSTDQVIDPNRCVVSTEVLTEGTTRLAVALNTLEFRPIASDSSLKVTIQLVSFVGPGMIKGYEDGNRGALEGLARHLGEKS